MSDILQSLTLLNSQMIQVGHLVRPVSMHMFYLCPITYLYMYIYTIYLCVCEIFVNLSISVQNNGEEEKNP
jgi:hypothetical protein